MNFQVLIIGSGPAGVSAAIPLVQAGVKVLMIDGGSTGHTPSPLGQFLNLRKNDEKQWTWMIGRDFHALRQFNAASPKLRTPTHACVFANFCHVNKIKTKDYIAVGSLAPGGLSNAWGCGVASLSNDELKEFPIDLNEIESSYKTVTTRIGVSGKIDDDLSSFFGLDEYSQPPINIDELHQSLLDKYGSKGGNLRKSGFRLGRARVAALSQPINKRKACDLSGTCLWGCSRQALYSATEDLKYLQTFKEFQYRSGFIVEDLICSGSSIAATGATAAGKETLNAECVLLAAGTLASTRLALKAINYRAPVSMQSCPTAAFMLWLPRYFGREHQAAFGLGQLSFVTQLTERYQAFGSLFSTTGIPVSEFARHLPFAKRYGVDILRLLLSSCVVGNLFLPGNLTQATLRLDDDDYLLVEGKYLDETTKLMKMAQAQIKNSFSKLGAILLPTSFKIGAPGSDIHYASSLPMSSNPQLGQTNKYGKLAGTERLYIVDGSVLSSLPAKSHTLTIMANADRIGKHIAALI